MGRHRQRRELPGAVLRNERLRDRVHRHKPPPNTAVFAHGRVLSGDAVERFEGRYCLTMQKFKFYYRYYL
jgi:hypothetical protein